MQTLLIKLTGVLQSYGEEALMKERTTNLYPTKSAVIGMLAAALGYQRNYPRLEKLNRLAFAVRIDQPGELTTDYQTMHVDKTAWHKADQYVTYRDYLQDAVFVAAVGSDDHSLIDQLATALKYPHFQLYLGRRANVPVGALQTTIIDQENPVTALTTYAWQAAKWYRRKHQRDPYARSVEIIADASLLPNHPVTVLKDEVVTFDQRNRQHTYRSVASQTVMVPDPDQGNGSVTHQDAFDAF